MSLRGKFKVMVAVATAGLIALAGFWITSQRSTMLALKIDTVRDLLAGPYSIVEREYELEKEGKINREEAQRRAVEAIRPMRYGDNNYYWVNDEHPTMIMHAMKPELDGTDLTDFKDPTGKAVFVEFVKATRTAESAYVYYHWPKPGHEKPVPKLSFVKRFEPWGWIIGTGIYIDDVDSAWRESALTAAGLAIVCLVLLMAISISTSRSIFLNLRRMVERVKDVAEGEGDLTKRVDIASDDEIGELAKWFNIFMDQFQEMIRGIADDAVRVASASEQLSTTTGRMAEHASRQQSQTAQIAISMQQMASTLSQVSQNCDHAAGNARQTASTARDGGKAAERTADQMRGLTESVRTIAQRISELGNKSGEIGRIVGVIDDIADQTNLLALNAAIEAARAGPQGRGFAVVADEVRKLAERTTRATQEIAEVISLVQQETRAAVQAMAQGTIQVAQGVAATNEAGSKLRMIIAGVEEGASLISQIAIAAAQQSSATDEVKASVSAVSNLAQESAASSSETAQACSELSQLAADLQNMVGKFKLEPGSGAYRGQVPERRTVLLRGHSAGVGR